LTAGIALVASTPKDAVVALGAMLPRLAGETGRARVAERAALSFSTG
jgi:hypothetical protein